MPYRVFPGADWRALLDAVVTISTAFAVHDHVAASPALAFVPDESNLAPGNAVHAHSATSPAVTVVGGVSIILTNQTPSAPAWNLPTLGELEITNAPADLVIEIVQPGFVVVGA